MSDQALKVIFLDRDGTIIYEPEDYQVDDLSKIRLVPKVISSLKKLNNYGYQLVMVSNQDGLGTDSFPQEAFDKCQSFILDLFSTQEIDFREILICPHLAEDQCDCRKPKTGLLTKFLTHENIDTARSYVIGDRDTDMLLAEKMKIQGIRIDPYKDDAWDKIVNTILNVDRQAEVLRKSNETEILTRVNLSASTPIKINTGIGFFDHMLEQLAKHSNISMEVECKGDLHIDEHHTIEDVSITIGDALYKALSNKVGIGRYGFTLPMDDALAMVAIDLSGRPYFKFEGEFNREKIGDLPTELITHFFYTLSQNMKANIHISITGEDDHHKAEACFKSVGRALSQAIKQTDSGDLPTTKGLL
jgi:imidazoleglycerol-phosphate dehydratase/histidinol-phosphatase